MLQKMAQTCAHSSGNTASYIIPCYIKFHTILSLVILFWGEFKLFWFRKKHDNSRWILWYCKYGEELLFLYW